MQLSLPATMTIRDRTEAPDGDQVTTSICNNKLSQFIRVHCSCQTIPRTSPRRLYTIIISVDKRAFGVGVGATA